LEFEWHDAKAEANLQAHGVSFDVAKFVLWSLTWQRERSSLHGTQGPDSHYLARKQHKMKKPTTSNKTVNSLRPMTSVAIERAARADRDAQPLSETDLRRMRRTPQVKIIRRALDLTQEEFSARYHIPLGTLRDWEQGRAEPDQPTRAYLILIARDPGHVNRTLNPKAS
jgi:putative transcriptional regulator